MDRRQSFRHSVNESVQVKSIADPEAVAVGRIDDISEGGMRLTLNGHFPRGSVIEVECKDWVLRGMVIHDSDPNKHGDAEYSYGIRMLHLAWNS